MAGDESFHVDIPGLPGFVSQFKGADRIVMDEMTRWGNRAGIAVAAEAKRRVPVRTHTLQRSYQSVTQASPLSVMTKVGTNVPYAGMVEFGTRPHEIRPRRSGGVLSFLIGGERIFARVVHHPGTKGRFPLTGALKSQHAAIRRDADVMVRRIVQRISGGAR